jgi:uncharacterized membrane protein
MTADDRLDRIEQRLATLETLVRDIATRAASPEPPRPRVAEPARPRVAEPPKPKARRVPRPALLDPEEWVGQRGLLAVGVVAMILAAGYLLKLSFDRGWISPALRCAGGALAGGGVAVLGWRLHARYRTYGAALVGCGAAIVYLAVWSASRLYDIVPPVPGIAVLAIVSLGLAAIAWKLDVEALGATAALGAFFAPILLGRETAEADLLLVYLATMAAGLGWVSAVRGWRLATFVVAASYFGLGGLAAPDAEPAGVVLHAAAGGAAGLVLGLRRRWWETRFLAFTGAWTMLAVAADSIATPLIVLAGAVALAIPVWAHTVRMGPRWPIERAGGAPRTASAGELLYFAATPFLVAWALRLVAPAWFDARDGLLPLVIAVPYLVAGYQRVRPAFAAVGLGALALAAILYWPGLGAPLALIVLSLVVAAVDEPLRRGDGRGFSLVLLALALLHLTETDRIARPEAEAAFVGPWALVLWAAAAAAMLLAWRLWRRAADPASDRLVRGGLWTTAGLIVFLGVTMELRRAFGVDERASSLAGELSVSAWWLAVSAALVLLGFGRGLKPVRVAGLVVAGLAVTKVVFSDLASLDALYRVASVFILGLVSLSLAYLYHRQARENAPAPPAVATVADEP